MSINITMAKKWQWIMKRQPFSMEMVGFLTLHVEQVARLKYEITKTLTLKANDKFESILLLLKS